MALAAILQGISEETLLQLGAKKSTKEAWDALKTMNLDVAPVKEVRAQALRWELEGLRMEDKESVDDFTGRISTIVNKLRGLGETIDEVYIVKKMLQIVSPKYIQLASTIEEFSDLTTKTIEEVTGSLKAHEEQLKGQDLKGDEHVLLTRGEWKAHGETSGTDGKRSKDQGGYRGCGRGKGRGRGHGNGRGRGQSKSKGGRGYDRDGNQHQKFDINKVRCYNCNDYGHFASDCKSKKKKDERAHLVE
ncbi:uncharacterized protein LOC110606242 [Manihot esculenta]|uniref:uncharacterized protein LOC110606242 n=1 Tax=Manihot esculenta TaxID=3983 RepID=UPI000B5D7AFA|nr:uncharacterized protein LOC110606242 [Manihot esculenta]